MVLAGAALDKVRYELQREGADLKGAMWSLRGNTWNLSEDRQEQRKNLCRQYTKLGRAMSLRETLQAIYANSDRQLAEAELHWWCGWAARSRLSPFRDLAKTVRKHWEGILAYFDTRLTSAAIEAVTGVIQLAKRMARGLETSSTSEPPPITEPVSSIWRYIAVHSWLFSQSVFFQHLHVYGIYMLAEPTHRPKWRAINH